MLDDVGRPGRAGAGVLRRVCEARAIGDAVADSEVEATLADVLVAHGLPVPEHHHVVRLGAVAFELDFAYPDLRVGIEVDGWASHGTRVAFERDRWRLNLLRQYGWVVLQFTTTMVLSTPREVAEQVAAVVAAARATAAAPAAAAPGAAAPAGQGVS